MVNTWEYLKGKKTYFALALGGVVIALNHVGIQVPGVHLDPNAYSEQFWALLTGAAVRHGMSTGK